MYKYKGIEINYKEYGKKDGEAIVYLHGWGQNIQMMEPIANPFEKSHHLVILDLPGFGASEEPKEAWTLDDYVDMIHELLKSLNIDNPNLIGHSFGGKLSLLYSTKYKTRRIVLLASPYKVKMNPESTKLKLLKKIKKIPILGLFADFAKKFMGSTDYKNASPRMREILVKHVNTDLTDKLDKVNCPALLIWGTADAAVPYEDAVELEKLIKDAGLVTYEGATHYAYLERLRQTINVLKSFIK